MQNGASCKKFKYNLLNIQPDFTPEEQTIPPTGQSFTLREQTILPFEPMTLPSEPALTPEAQNHPSRKQKTMY